MPQWLIVVLQKYLRRPTDAASQQYQKKRVLQKNLRQLHRLLP